MLKIDIPKIIHCKHQIKTKKIHFEFFLNIWLGDLKCNEYMKLHFFSIWWNIQKLIALFWFFCLIAEQRTGNTWTSLHTETHIPLQIFNHLLHIDVDILVVVTYLYPYTFIKLYFLLHIYTLVVVWLFNIIFVIRYCMGATFSLVPYSQNGCFDN